MGQSGFETRALDVSVSATINPLNPVVDVVGLRQSGGTQLAQYWNFQLKAPNLWGTSNMLQPPGTTLSISRASRAGQWAVISWTAGGIVGPFGIPWIGSYWTSPVNNVKLHPSGNAWKGSHVYDLCVNKQVGYVTPAKIIWQWPNISFSFQDRASWWSGSPISRIDLHPAPASLQASRALGASGDGTQQVGYCMFKPGGASPAIPVASLWSGSSASWAFLNPNIATSSIAYDANCVSGGGHAQFGMAVFSGAPKAVVWKGSQPTWSTQLHPSWAVRSEAWTADGPLVAGYAGSVGGPDVAMVLLDPLGNQHDIGNDLPGPVGTWGNSYATGTTCFGRFLCVSGYAFNIPNARYEAVLWIGEWTVGDCDGDGNSTMNDWLCFLATKPSHPHCPEDLNGDGVIDGADQLALLNAPPF